MVTIKKVKCPKCGHAWQIRTAQPVQCPGCRYRIKRGQRWEE